MTADKPIYFKGLDTLRFLCCLLVIVTHVEFSKILLLTPPDSLQAAVVDFVNPYSYLMLWSELAVDCFFAMSGFLISYLLFAEKRATSTISLKRFYLKRIVRVWPVYYLIVLLGFLVFPHIEVLKIPVFTEMLVNSPHFYEKFFYFLVVLPNIGFMHFFIPYLSHIWSVGVEEIFYYTWAPLIKWSSRYLKIFIAILTAFVLVGIVVGASPGTHELPLLFRAIPFWSNVFYYLSIGSMAIGGLYAYIYFYKKENILKILYRKDTQTVVYISLALMLIFRVYIPLVHHYFYAVLIGFLILNIGTNPRSIIRLDYKPTNYWGKLSYGIYIYHFIPITLIIKFGITFFDSRFETFGANMLLYVASILGSMLFAYVSYHLFEKRFLALKNIYS